MEDLHYDEMAQLEETHWWHLARQRIIPDWLGRQFRRLGFKDNLKILDLGCGTGKMLKVLKQFGETTGVDSSQKAIEYCKTKGAGNVVLADATKLPFRKESFDVVTAMELLEHIEDDAGALREWFRVLKPGGVLFLTAPAYMWMWGSADRFAHHKRRYTLGDLAALAKYHGFHVTKATYFNTLLFPGVALIRLFRKMFLRVETMTSADLARAFDFNIGPKFLNGFFTWLFSLERYLLRWLSLPFGVSMMAVALKSTRDERLVGDRELSLVLPIHNHADFLEEVINHTEKVLADAGLDFEMILAENGSTDGSWAVCKKLARQSKRIKVLRTQAGYGRAIIAGLKKAKGKLVGYTEANGLIYPNVIPYLVWLIEDGHCDLAKGLRIQRETRFRAVQSKIYNWLVNLLFNLHLADTNTCPKVFPRGYLKQFKLEHPRSFIDLEIMFKSDAMGLRVLEVPIPYLPRAGGRSMTNWRTIVQFFGNMLSWRFWKLRKWVKNL